MIRVTVELVSARHADRDRLLGVAYLANTGAPDTQGLMTYDVWLSKTLPGLAHQKWRGGRAGSIPEELAHVTAEATGLHTEVACFDNQRRGVWDLLYLALKAVVAGRNP